MSFDPQEYAHQNFLRMVEDTELHRDLHSAQRRITPAHSQDCDEAILQSLFDMPEGDFELPLRKRRK